MTQTNPFVQIELTVNVFRGWSQARTLVFLSTLNKNSTQEQVFAFNKLRYLPSYRMAL